MSIKINLPHEDDKTLNIFSVLTGLLIFTSPFLHFISVNYLESIFNKTLFLKFSLLAIATITVLAVTATFIISRFLLCTAFYRLFTVFYTGFLFLFTYLPIRHLVLSLGLPESVRFIYAPFVLLALWIVFRLTKFRKFHLIALVFALVLTAGPIVRIVHSTLNSFDRSIINTVDYKTEFARTFLKKVIEPANLPNIYFVVPDRYTSVAVLRDKLGFNNNPFIHEMEKRGFVHLSDSFSAYIYTALSIASLLQADYPISEDSSQYTFYTSAEKFYPSILYKNQPFQVAKAARHLGYTVSIVGNRAVDCGGGHVYCSKDKSNWFPNEIQSFFEMTPLLRILRRIEKFQMSGGANGIDAIRRAVQYIGSTNRPPRPYFMLIHDLTTHEDFFDADCRVRSNDELKNKPNYEQAKQFYLDSVQCTNKKLIEFADYIAKVDPTALVAIQADHGSRFSAEKNLMIAFKDWSENDIQERISVLSLVRVPDKCRKWLRPDLNTVNTVRFLFGCATLTEPVYLENKSYLSSFEKSTTNYGLKLRVR